MLLIPDTTVPFRMVLTIDSRYGQPRVSAWRKSKSPVIKCSTRPIQSWRIDQQYRSRQLLHRKSDQLRTIPVTIPGRALESPHAVLFPIEKFLEASPASRCVWWTWRGLSSTLRVIYRLTVRAKAPENDWENHTKLDNKDQTTKELRLLPKAVKTEFNRYGQSWLLGLS